MYKKVYIIIFYIIFLYILFSEGYVANEKFKQTSLYLWKILKF